LQHDSVVRKFRMTAKDGKYYNVEHYNLDLIISLGYRVKSRIATKFCQWVTMRLREYVNIPCFSLIKQNGGIPIAVYDHKQTEKWGNAFQFVADGRVSNLYSANYREGSDLVNFLTMAVRSLAERIAVSASSYQG